MQNHITVEHLIQYSPTIAEYIQSMYFPLPRLHPSRLGRVGPDGRVVAPWPYIERLVVPKGTRMSRSAGFGVLFRLSGENLTEEALSYVNNLLAGSRELTCTDIQKGQLQLPGTHISLTGFGIQRSEELIRTRKSSDSLAKLVLRVLNNMAGLFWILFDQTPGTPEARLTLFSDRTNEGPSYMPHELFIRILMMGDPNCPFVVIVVPPWLLGPQDFQDFVGNGKSLNSFGMLEFDSPRQGPNDQADSLWAVVWDVCRKTDSRYFAVTTYSQWAFGHFRVNFDEEIASDSGLPEALWDEPAPGFITEIMDAPVVNADEKPVVDAPENDLMATLMYWVQLARGAVHEMEFEASSSASLFTEEVQSDVEE